MIWTVVYRDDATGRQGKLELDAANRGDVFTQMHAKKLRVLNVMEGKVEDDKPKKKKKEKGTTSLGGRLLFWLLFLLAAGGAAFWILRDSPLLEDYLRQLDPNPPPPPPGKAVIRLSGENVDEAAAPGDKRPGKGGIRISPADGTP